MSCCFCELPEKEIPLSLRCRIKASAWQQPAHPAGFTGGGGAGGYSYTPRAAAGARGAQPFGGAAGRYSLGHAGPVPGAAGHGSRHGPFPGPGADRALRRAQAAGLEQAATD